MKVHISETLVTIIHNPSSFVKSFPTLIRKRLPDEIAVVCVSPKESQKLNHAYRKKDIPTNVLSFFYNKTYGEIIVCPAVVRAEAHVAGNSYKYQMTWMIVHGMIHLAGIHHERSSGMEKKSVTTERRILADIFRTASVKKK